MLVFLYNRFMYAVNEILASSSLLLKLKQALWVILKITRLGKYFSLYEGKQADVIYFSQLCIMDFS